MSARRNGIGGPDTRQILKKERRAPTGEDLLLLLRRIRATQPRCLQPRARVATKPKPKSSEAPRLTSKLVKRFRVRGTMIGKRVTFGIYPTLEEAETAILTIHSDPNVVAAVESWTIVIEYVVMEST